MKRHGEITYREQVWVLLDREGLLPIGELAERVGCGARTAGAYRRAWVVQGGEDRREGRANGGCKRCGVLGWERNPVVAGKCLWCRADAEGADVWEMNANGEWNAILAVVEAFRGKGEEVLIRDEPGG